jgi:hypothetical protein
MTDTTPPEMEETTAETYREGVLVETHTIAVPKEPPSLSELMARIAELEEKLAAQDSAEPQPVMVFMPVEGGE